MLIDLAKHRAVIDQISLAAAKLHVAQATAIQQILEGFVALGFSSARLYECAHNTPDSDELLVLSAAVGTHPGRIGYRIDYRNSTAGRAGGTDPVKGSSNSPGLSPGEKQWIMDLDLNGRDWVDLPLHVNSKLLGLIACDYDPSIVSLQEPDVVVLGLLASRIATNLALAPIHLVEATRGGISSALALEDDLKVLLGEAAEGIRSALHGAVISVFEYRWDSDSLRKEIERVDPSLSARAGDFKEEYWPDSPSLTRKAWLEPDYRHIVDFESVQEKASYLVDQSSFDRHSTLLGKVTSVLYATVGTVEPRFLLRLMNRCDDPQLPLVLSHKEVFDALSSELSKAVDRLVTKRRLKRLQLVATGIVEKLHSVDEAMRLIRTALSEEDIEAFAVMSHCDGSSSFRLERYYGGCLANWSPSAGARLWEEDRLYSIASSHDQPSFVELTKESEMQRPNTLGSHLLNRKVSCVLTLPFSAPRTHGAIICPLPVREKEGKQLTPRRRPMKDKLEALASYASVVGSYIEALDSHLTAERARMLVGHIGHEVNTPATILGQKAVEALYLATDAVPSSALATRAKLEAAKSDIKDHMRTVNQTMSIALMVAQENKGRLQLHFRRSSLNRILEDARDSLHSEMTVRNQQGGYSHYQIELGPSCARLGEIVCDPDLLKHVFTNLFRNGMKYSLPRFPRKPMTVDVLGMRQSNMTILQVTNWGLGISPDDFERIFSAFARGSVHDRLKAIRGMGLGLYISRRIVAAHQGKLFCDHSTCTLDDPLRREMWEGFESTFEVRLPHTLAEGITEHVWDKHEGI